jgi:hypothetical protein
MLTKLWDLAYEIDGDNIDLEQDMGCGEVARVTLHRMHLRHLAEQAGLIPASAHENPDQVIARLGRQLRALFDRINTLDEWLRQAASRGHEDLSDECTYSFCTWEMAMEFVTDLDAVTQGHGASRNVTQGRAPDAGDAAATNLPKNGATSLSNSPKNGAVGRTNDPESGGIQTDLLSALDGGTDGSAMAQAIEGERA